MRAAEHWTWQYDTTSERLSLHLSDEFVHNIPFKASKLVAMVSGEFAFDCEDAHYYHELIDYLEARDAIAPVEQLAIALNATAWTRFGRPQMPQSWHFQQSERPLPNTQRICELNSGFTAGQFLIVQRDTEFASCMLLDEQMSVSDIKSLKQYDVVKVLLNRLQPSALDPVIDVGQFASQKYSA